MTSKKKLHQRDVMLIRRLKVRGLSGERIWSEYRISIPVIQRAKDEIERQATEEFESKEHHAVELANYRDRLKIIIDGADSIIKHKNLSIADRIKFERIMLELLAMLQDAIEASIISPNPRSALKKIIEQSDNRS
jgi:hypothetical protein